MASDQCYHQPKITPYGWKIFPWRKIRNQKLANENTWIYECKWCGAWKIKKLVPTYEAAGPGFVIKSYFVKNEKEGLKTDRSKTIGPVQDKPD